MKNFVDAKGNSIEVDLAVDSTTPGLMTNDDKTKLDGIEAGANKYVQPTSFPATMIAEDTGHKFITDAERTAWNAKAANIIATQTVNGLMSAADKTKLDGIATGANAYTHPTTHPASIIVQDASNRFVTDTEKATWNAKAGSAVATTTANGMMSAADKVLVNNCTYTTGGAITTGIWKKYGDGTLEIWGRSALEYTNELWSGTLSSSGFSYSIPFTVTLPVTAVGNISCTVTVESTNVTWADISSSTTTTFKYRLICPVPDKVYGAYIHWHVLGKWK